MRRRVIGEEGEELLDVARARCQCCVPATLTVRRRLLPRLRDTKILLNHHSPECDTSFTQPNTCTREMATPPEESRWLPRTSAARLHPPLPSPAVSPPPSAVGLDDRRRWEAIGRDMACMAAAAAAAAAAEEEEGGEEEESEQLAIK